MAVKNFISFGKVRNFLRSSFIGVALLAMLSSSFGFVAARTVKPKNRRLDVQVVETFTDNLGNNIEPLSVKLQLNKNNEIDRVQDSNTVIIEIFMEPGSVDKVQRSGIAKGDDSFSLNLAREVNVGTGTSNPTTVVENIGNFVFGIPSSKKANKKGFNVQLMLDGVDKAFLDETAGLLATFVDTNGNPVSKHKLILNNVEDEDTLPNNPAQIANIQPVQIPQAITALGLSEADLEALRQYIFSEVIVEPAIEATGIRSATYTDPITNKTVIQIPFGGFKKSAKIIKPKKVVSVRNDVSTDIKPTDVLTGLEANLPAILDGIYIATDVTYTDGVVGAGVYIGQTVNGTNTITGPVRLIGAKGDAGPAGAGGGGGGGGTTVINNTTNNTFLPDRKGVWQAGNSVAGDLVLHVTGNETVSYMAAVDTATEPNLAAAMNDLANGTANHPWILIGRDMTNAGGGGGGGQPVGGNPGFNNNCGGAAGCQVVAVLNNTSTFDFGSVDLTAPANFTLQITNSSNQNQMNVVFTGGVPTSAEVISNATTPPTQIVAPIAFPAVLPAPVNLGTALSVSQINDYRFFFDNQPHVRGSQTGFQALEIRMEKI